MRLIGYEPELLGELTAYNLLLTAELMFRKTLTILSLLGLLLSASAWCVGSFYSLESDSKSCEFGVGDRSVFIGAYPRGSSVAGIKGLHWLEHRTWCGLGMPLLVTFPGEVWLLKLPLWIPTFLFGSIFCLCRSLHRHRCRKRKKLGLCLECGYDLRGSGERCPECGTLVERDRPRLQCEE